MSGLDQSTLAQSTLAESATPLVRVENVHTYYGKSHILRGVSLEVAPGEVVGLLGRNGVGKSTTLKTIMGLVRPSRGTVRFEGFSFGSIEIDGITYEHDMVIDRGEMRKRRKKPVVVSKSVLPAIRQRETAPRTLFLCLGRCRPWRISDARFLA